MKTLFPDRLCAVIAADTAAGALALIRQAGTLTHTIEVRLDWMISDKERADFLNAWKRQRRRPATIATLRSQLAGGRFTIRKATDMNLQLIGLGQAAEAGADWLDVEMETLADVSPQVRKMFLKMPAFARGKVGLIASLHDFQRTRKPLEPIRSALEQLGGKVLKIATRCRNYSDGLRLLALCRGRKNVIAVPMGDIGLPLRVLALRMGSALAYASVGERTAPGQLTLEEMKHLYRADRLNKQTKVYGVIGDPVAHSLSPLMHNHALRHAKLNAVYLPFLVRDLREFLFAVPELGICGFSVTLPHKQRILRHLDECDAAAERMGAVNTVVVNARGKLHGHNTDAAGILRALARRVQLRNARALILGAGGVARAAAFALVDAGANVFICARREGQARALARACGGEAIARRLLASAKFDIISNCTPVGMAPHTGESPLEPQELNARLVFDAIYRPAHTRLLRLAADRGIQTVGGAEFFIAQGAAQFELWTGRRAPLAVMRRAVRDALHE